MSSGLPVTRASYDAVVVGSGPNGLAAAIVLAKAGLSTLLVEACDSLGGGARSSELTLPGYMHDVCSTVHPLAVAGPFFRSLRLEERGVRWCQPPLPLVHVLSDGTAVPLARSIEETAAGLGADGSAYADLMTPLVEQAPALFHDTLGPLRVPRHPALLARFGWDALRSLASLVRRHFSESHAGALLAGMGAHAMQPLDSAATAAFALVLGVAAHAVGWPVAAGGSRVIVEAMARIFDEHGGEVVLGQRITSFDQLPRARAYLFDVTPRQLLHIAGGELGASYRSRLRRFRYGPGVCKVDWALSGPVPWLDERCRRAATVHLSGDFAEVAAAEAAVQRGHVHDKPFVIFVQPSLFDASRAPAGRHTGWAYCHVPWASNLDASELIELQVERFAPGFRQLIFARSVTTTDALERYNGNYVGGDINAGSATLDQLFTRPVARLDPYTTSDPRIFLCSASTPPGGGVHGMCGYFAAASALRRAFKLKAVSLE
jgi:phytoene dehydrogenase-like protein